MRGRVAARRALIAVAACAATALIAVLALALGIDAGLFRGTLIRFIAAGAERPIEVAGALHVHLLERHPTLSAERVIIGSPEWAPAGPLAEIGEISLTLEVPWLDGRFGIIRLAAKSATLHLKRDAEGHANWQWRNPDQPPSAQKLPILRSLSIPDAHVALDDPRRHLTFDGVVTADGGEAGEHPRLDIVGHGQLNGHAASFEVMGDALTAASHRTPYHFSFLERSGGSSLEGEGVMPTPFDFDLIDATFRAEGADLRDLYFLTGVTLINSGKYRLTGKILRRGPITRFEDLAATTGQSDVRGDVSVDMSSGRTRLDVDLRSRNLKMADWGLRAAGRSPPGAQPPLLLSDAMFEPRTLRRGDAKLAYRADRLEFGRFELTEVAARGALEQGVLDVTPLTAHFVDGELHSHLKLDARTDAPKTDIDMRFSHLELADLFRNSSTPPPAEGLLEARIAVTGVGKSVHQIAASANGMVSATLLAGSVRDSLAEMSGLDLRGLGLLLTKSEKQVPIRCAVAQFEDHDGTLTANRLVMDTAPVLIIGTGQIHLDTETLDMTIRGHPKGVRLIRFRAPVIVKGSLAHPSMGLQAHGLQLVDPGRAPDADCGALEAPTAAGP